jgi:hypothetical protein
MARGTVKWFNPCLWGLRHARVLRGRIFVGNSMAGVAAIAPVGPNGHGA